MKNFFRSLFPKKKSSVDRTLTLSPQDALQIVHWYGEIMEHANGAVEDDSQLTVPKGVVKLALLTLLRGEKDAAQRDHLVGGYLMLSTFQPLTDAEKSVLKQYRAAERKHADLNAQPIDKQRVALAEIAGIFPAYDALIQRTGLEMEVLQSELKAAGIQS